MADISKPSKTAMDIFCSIMDYGPLTLYAANSKTKMPIGTIHRHFKLLEKAGKIRIYDSIKKGRKKIEYGPTIYGILSFYRQDKRIAEKIENYFLLWAENREFQYELHKEGFERFDAKKSQKAKKIFHKYMDYFSAIEDQIETIKNGNDVISRDILIMISSSMLSSNPRYKKMWNELYQNLPGMRVSLDNYMKSMIKPYKELKIFNSKI